MLAPPRTPRDTFELLARLDPADPLHRLLERVDWQDVTPRQVAYAALGRLPEDIHYAGLANAAFDPASHFASLLLSTEFQSGIVSNLLGAFPEKPRRFFIHVPRCGGTSLGETLATQACTVPHNALGADWCGGREFLDHAAGICRAIPSHEAIHVSGHYTLRSIAEARLVRFGDRVWTSVRPPQALMLSYINYILTVLDTDPDLIRPDTQHWTKMLGLEQPVSRMSAGQRQRLLTHMVTDGRLVPRDMICHFLGDGTADSALDLLAAADAEIIDSTRMDTWREQKWCVAAPPWRNVSQPFFRWSELRDQQRKQIEAVVRQDMMLYRKIAATWGKQVSAQGLHVAQTAPGLTRPATAAVLPGRLKHASRPLLRDPDFKRLPIGAVGWGGLNCRWTTIRLKPRFVCR